MTRIDLHPVRNNPDLPEFFKQHLMNRICEHGGHYGRAWKLIKRFREGRYCLANKSDGRLCLNSAVIPGGGPRGRCVWHGGKGTTGPNTEAGKAVISNAQKLRWAKFRIANGVAREDDFKRLAR